jgi:hypothetical protein
MNKMRFPLWCCIVIVGVLLPVEHVVQAQQPSSTARTSAILSAGLNLGGLDDLLATVREDLVPELVIAMNEFIDNNLSFSRRETALGVTVTVSAGISEFVLQTADNAIGLRVEDDAASSSTTATTVKLNASNVKLGATASATVAVSAPGLGSVSCYLGVDAIANVRSLEFDLGVAKDSSSSSNNDITIRAADANVPSFVVGLTPKTSTNNLCNAVNQLIASVFGVVTNQISSLALALFDGKLVEGLAAVLDNAIVPIAQFDQSVSIGNAGIIRPIFRLEKISAVSNTFVVDVGGALDVELRQPAFRAGRSLTASTGTSTAARTMPQVSVDGLVGMHLKYVQFTVYNSGKDPRLLFTMHLLILLLLLPYKAWEHSIAWSRSCGTWADRLWVELTMNGSRENHRYVRNRHKHRTRVHSRPFLTSPAFLVNWSCSFCSLAIATLAWKRFCCPPPSMPLLATTRTSKVPWRPASPLPALACWVMVDKSWQRRGST